ncbi:Coatomer subunit alpha [Orchesella cincta]|uniref:Coatomer subunit alpha n=1 Tax=Orchesella cincta TaxID=48709 RepID=A0A1D2M577_ORCCI|nr:Coatomer subunit alpha [Orchesella cincta]
MLTKSARVKGLSFHPRRPWILARSEELLSLIFNKLSLQLFAQWKHPTMGLRHLFGHLDYLRRTYFHQTHPCILSASDDQTIRIWNWQSRNCLTILTVRKWHPTDEDLVVSASLNQTVRVWNISRLRMKPTKGPRIQLRNNRSPDLFPPPDAVINLINCWEVGTCRGHYNNVSSVIFHPRQDCVLSNSEDKSIRVWCKTGNRAYHDRFWMLEAHPTKNIWIGRGQLSLFMEISLCHYIKERLLRRLDLTTSKDQAVLQLKGGPRLNVRSLSYNPAENTVLLTTRPPNSDNGSYELYVIPGDTNSSQPAETAECKNGTGMKAIWVARNRFALLDTSHHLVIKNLKNEVGKKIQLPKCDDIFWAGTGMLLLREPDSISLYDVQLKRTLAQLKMTPKVGHVVWTSDMSHVALLTKRSVTLCNRTASSILNSTKSHVSNPELGMIYRKCSSTPPIIYSNMPLRMGKLNALRSNFDILFSDNGIIRTLEIPLYITKVKDHQIFCLDRDVKARVLNINPTEYQFKLALINRNYDEILRMVRSSNLLGQAMIAYLQKRGYPEVALHFVKDEKTRFILALECGNITVAFDAAKALDEAIEIKAFFYLNEFACKFQIVELCYQRTKNFAKLTLYTITASKTLEDSRDSKRRVIPLRALLLGDVGERVRLLKGGGLTSLAYLTALSHGWTEETDQLEMSNFKTWRMLFRVNISWRSYISSWGVGIWRMVELSSDLKVSGTVEVVFEQSLKGFSVPQRWTNSSKCAIDHVYAGSFESAARLLYDQIGVVSIEPFRQLFLGCLLKVTGFIYCFPIYQRWFTQCEIPRKLLLLWGIRFQTFVQKLQFRSLLLSIPLTFVENKSDLTFIQELVILCREYILGLQMELYRKDLSKDTIENQVRSCELAAYFTHCTLDAVHSILTLRTAMNLSFKLKNYKTAASFSKRLLEQGPKAEIAQQTRKLLQVCEKNPVDEHAMEYDEQNPFSVCAVTYKPIYRGKPEVKCPFCRATFMPQFEGSLCVVCTVAEVGKEDVLGLRISPIQFR